MVNKVCRCDLTALTKFVAEIMAIQAGLTAVRFYYNVFTSPENQLELVMEGVQVKLSLKLYVPLPVCDLFQACLNDNQAQARNGQAACNYKEVMDHLKVTLTQV